MSTPTNAQMVLIIEKDEDGTLTVKQHGDQLIHEFKTKLIGEIYDEYHSRHE